ncbi:MAG: hypothetical protein AAGC64_04565 [Bacteroidota bacterium]
MGLDVNPQKFKDYETKDLAYKNQSREIICNRLGYEPPLRVSVLSELMLRIALKRHDLGEESGQSLEEFIQFQADFINRLMMERIDSFSC